MANTQLTPFGREVKIALMDKRMSQIELAEQLRMKTGKYVDGQYVSKILFGQRKSPVLVSAMREILEIPEKGA